MKREGRQHGMVRTYRILPSPLNPRPGSSPVNRFDSPPTAGLFTKVQSKPTNHSKFTGKCGRARCVGCHMHPACKSKDKTKGTQKLKSGDVVTNYKLVSWRVVDGRLGLNFSGFSASGILDHLSSAYSDDYDYDYDYETDDYAHNTYNHDADNGPSCVADDPLISDFQSFLGEEEIKKSSEIQEILNDQDDDTHNDCDYDDDEDAMSFCEIGILLDQVEGDEGWCLVGEM